MSLPRVAVMVVTYGSADDVANFLQSTTSRSVIETVVVDNPTDESDAIAIAVTKAGARFLRLDQNVGYGGAVNAGVASLTHDVDYLLISNPDVRLHDGAVEALVEALERNPATGAVGPKILNNDGTPYPSARRIPSLRTGVGHALFSRWWPNNPWSRSYRQDNASSDLPRDVGWLSGACLLIRRSAFAEVDGFDAEYFMYFEDVDLGYRLGKAGWVNRYEPAAVATHTGGTSTSREAGRMLRVHHRSAARFLSSRYRGWHLAPLRWALHAGLEVRARWVTRRVR